MPRASRGIAVAETDRSGQLVRRQPRQQPAPQGHGGGRRAGHDERSDTLAESFVRQSESGCVRADACTWMQIVGVHSADHLITAYHSCGWYASISQPTGEKFWGSTQIDFQPNNSPLGGVDTNPPTCWQFPDPKVNRKKDWGYTGPDCFRFEADEWLTFQIVLHVGTWQPNRTGAPNTRFQLWTARQGEPQRLTIDQMIYLRGPHPSVPNAKYGKIWLLPFMTNKDNTQVHPTAHFWYDELIVSKQFIADPK